MRPTTVWLEGDGSQALTPMLAGAGMRAVSGPRPPARPRPDILLLSAGQCDQRPEARLDEVAHVCPAALPVIFGAPWTWLQPPPLAQARYMLVLQPVTLPQVVLAVQEAFDRVRDDGAAAPLPGRRRILLDLPSSIDVVQPATLYLTDACRRIGHPEDWLRTAVPLALTEALVNAATHGNRESASRRVRADLRIDSSLFRCSIADEGDGFDPSRVPIPTDRPYLLREHGRGLFLIRHYMTDVSFNALGNCITLSRRC